MQRAMIIREQDRLRRSWELREDEGAFLPAGAGPKVDEELIAFARQNNEAREVEGVGMVLFTAVRPLGTFQVSERSLGFFGTVTEKTDEAVREAFEEALEGGAFE